MQLIGISLQEGDDPIKKIKAFRSSHHLTYPIVSDEPGAIIGKFGFSGIPQDVVIDTNGKYVAAPETVEDLTKALKKLIK